MTRHVAPVTPLPNHLLQKTEYDARETVDFLFPYMGNDRIRQMSSRGKTINIDFENCAEATKYFHDVGMANNLQFEWINISEYCSHQILDLINQAMDTTKPWKIRLIGENAFFSHAKIGIDATEIIVTDFNQSFDLFVRGFLISSKFASVKSFTIEFSDLVSLEILKSPILIQRRRAFIDSLVYPFPPLLLFQIFHTTISWSQLLM
jgi:hypothetical protein